MELVISLDLISMDPEERYSRQVLFPGIGREGQQKLATARVTLVGCGVTIWNQHRQTIQQNRVAVTNLGVVLAEQTSRYVQVVDLTLQEVQSRVANLNISSPDEPPDARRH